MAQRQSPTFTVLLAAYNGEAVLPRALDSLISQTRTDWEVIVVDDGSTDGTENVARAYAARDSRVRVVTKPNGGTSSARNAGAKYANGRYFTLLDQDDWYLSEFFERAGAFAEGHPDYDIYSFSALYLYDDGRSEPRPQSPQTVTSYSIGDLIEGCAIHPQAVFRREVLETIGGFDEDPRCWTEDYDFWLRALCAGFRHIYDPEVLGVYRWSVAQKSSAVARCLASDAYILDKIARSGCLSGRLLSRAKQRARIQHRACAAIDDPSRLELEQRLRDGDLTDARKLYLASHRGWASPLKYYGALPLVMLSPRAFRALFAPRLKKLS